MKKSTLSIIQGLSGTVGFSILLFYGYSSKTAFAFVVLLSFPYVLSRIAIREPQSISIKKEQPRMTTSYLFTFLAIIFGLKAGAMAVTKIDKESFQAIIEYKPFLINFYFCFMSALIAETVKKLDNTNNEKSVTEQGHRSDRE